MKTCYITNSNKYHTINETSSSSSESSIIQNVTEPLLSNLNQFFDIDLISSIIINDLNVLRILLCFHHEVFSIIFITIFLIQHFLTIFLEWYRIFLDKFLWLEYILKNRNNNFDPNKLKSKKFLNGSFPCSSSSSTGKVLNDGNQQLTTSKTIYFKLKKIISAILILVYLIEVSIIILLCEHKVSDEMRQYLCSTLFSLASMICVLFYMFNSEESCQKHQTFICFYWLISLLNFLWRCASFFILITDDFNIWDICYSCQWKFYHSSSSYYLNVVQNKPVYSWPELLSFRQEVENISDEKYLKEKIRLIWFCFNGSYCLLFFIQFVFSFFPDLQAISIGEKLNSTNEIHFQPPANPEQYATLFGRAFFVWISSTIYRGYRRPLTKSDIFQTSLPVEQMEKHFSESLNDIKPGLLKHRRKPGVRLIQTLIWQFGAEFFRISLLKLVPTLTVFLGPILLSRLIEFSTNTENLEASWNGYVYVFAMFFLYLLESILNSYSDYQLMVLALKIRANLIAAIYRRLLQSRIRPIDKSKTKSSRHSSHTSGQIINFMSSDTQRIFEYIKMINLFWICPLQFMIAAYLLWQQLGYASLAGFSVLLLLTPLNGLIGIKIRNLQARFLGHKDHRIKAINETLSGIRALKLYAWEEFFQKRISDSRMFEIAALRIQAIFTAFITLAFTSAPFFISFASFATFLSLNSDSEHLNANKAFVSLAIINIVRRPLGFFPKLVTNSLLVGVSLKRISGFLEPDLNSLMSNNMVRAKDSKTDARISIKDSSFTWCHSTDTTNFQLKNIDFSIIQPELCAVVGGIGSGKSSFLSAILGQMNMIIKPGQEYFICDIVGKIAYVPQNSWIQSGTIRENILFGLEYDPIRYWKVIDACDLVHDLENMSDGDKTLVGEKGYDLSGGQRQRISLARAVYSDADIYLLDDPLSALDSKVSKHVFQRVISDRGLLANKIRLLVTNNMALLPSVNRILLLESGRIVAQGKYSSLINQENKFTNFLTTFFSTDSYQNEDENDLLVDEEEEYEILNEMIQRLEGQFNSFSRRGSQIRKISKSKLDSKKKKINFKLKFKNKRKPSEIDFTESKLPTGSILRVYWKYIRVIGILPFILVLLSYFIGTCFEVSGNLWLSSWSNDDGSYQELNSTMNILLMRTGMINSTTQDISQWTMLSVYGFFGIGKSIFIFTGALLVYLACLRGSYNLHSSMLNQLMRAPIWFFDQVTSGQILNRFDKDIDMADTLMTASLRLFMTEMFRGLALFYIISMSTNLTIILGIFLPLVIAYFFIYKYYISTSRGLMRLEPNLRTPIYLLFNETCSGVSVIQAFDRKEIFLNKIYQHIDTNTSALHMSIAATKWLSVRLECLGNLIVLLTSLSCVLFRGQITPGMVGLCISSSLKITGTLNWLLRSLVDLETNTISVERLLEYTKLPQEDEWHRDPQTDPTKQNPILTKLGFINLIDIFLKNKQRNKLMECRNKVDTDGCMCLNRKKDIVQKGFRYGSINFCQYSSRYHNSSQLCLKNLNLYIEPGAKVGIVGRTGAGKSSFAMALFRMIEPEDGCIFIDEYNIQKLGLHDLRSALTIIPQEPLLFTGTLRENLDPFSHYSDYRIIEALIKAHLGDLCHSAAGLSISMDTLMSRLSFGQKQLLCLARALLSRSRILVLDEATAGIDPATDLLVQETIRFEFNQCTVLTIAHRLKTIMEYDRILVFDQGQIIEFDSPKTLISNQSSMFYKMTLQ